MVYKCRFTFLGLVFIILCFIVSSFKCMGEELNIDNKRVLIIGSYNSQNAWEESVIKGFKEQIDKNISISIEFLDSQTTKSNIYENRFLELLKLKYSKNDIDCIFTIDDEAFEFARKNLFYENSFMYKKPIVFAGVNSYIMLSKEENEYITGIIEYQDNVLILETILNGSKNVEDIYLLLDNSIYSETLKSNVENLLNCTERSFNMKIIQGDHFDEIKEKLKDTNNDKSAILISGSYKNLHTEELISPEIVIQDIKKITNAPIYTKIEPYVKVGVIGGIVNDGYRLGNMASRFLTKVVTEGHESFFIPSKNSFGKSIFDYEEVMKYKINPLALPKDTEFINRGTFDILVPRYMQFIIWISIFIFILTIIVLTYIYIRDKKESKKNDILLNESLERHKIRTDFILTISHELRTPLNIMINSTKLLKLKIDEEKFDSKFFYEQLGIVTKNSNRLIRLVNNLIDVSKIESGYMDTTFTNENVVDIVEDATLSVVDLARSYDISITFDTEEEEIMSSVDVNKIERIMLNLLSNAIKFTGSGGDIFVNISKEDNNIIINVKDNGIGMSDELKVHLFEKFRRAKLYPSLEREHEGSGLGLFIVKGLVELHKGTIDVKSEINEGTTFTISIPQALVDDEISSNSLMNMPIGYVSEIELADINEKDYK